MLSHTWWQISVAYMYILRMQEETGEPGENPQIHVKFHTENKQAQD